VISTLLDHRFAVDPHSTMSPEHVEELEAQTPEEFRLFSRSIISLDPPDHTRLRKLVQPSFTGRGMQALRGTIQQVVDDLLDHAERDAAEPRFTATVLQPVSRWPARGCPRCLVRLSL
jgi:cytochrome P450